MPAPARADRLPPEARTADPGTFLTEEGGGAGPPRAFLTVPNTSASSSAGTRVSTRCQSLRGGGESCRLPRPRAGEDGRTRFLCREPLPVSLRILDSCDVGRHAPLASALLDRTDGDGPHALLDEGSECALRVAIERGDIAVQGQALDAAVEGSEGVGKVTSERCEPLVVILGERAQVGRR